MLLRKTPWATMFVLCPPAGHVRICNHLIATANPCRWISEETLNADADAVADLLERSIVKKPRVQGETSSVILTTRREALSLYREIWRASRLFTWNDDLGRPWKEVIRKSARKEYEEARHERDPELVNRLIITGRDCVQRTLEQMHKKAQQLADQQLPTGRPHP